MPEIFSKTQLEQELQDHLETPLPKLLSPEKGASREKQLVCCEELMSPHQQCRKEIPNLPCNLCGKHSKTKKRSSLTQGKHRKGSKVCY